MAIAFYLHIVEDKRCLHGKSAGRNFAQDWNRQPPDRRTFALLVLRIQFGNVKQSTYSTCVYSASPGSSSQAVLVHVKEK